jgi:hypothetical protein
MPRLTNHQETIDWPENAKFKTIERSNFWKIYWKKTFHHIKCPTLFLDLLCTTAFEHGFGTLYTAVYKEQWCTDGHMRKY